MNPSDQGDILSVPVLFLILLRRLHTALRWGLALAALTAVVLLLKPRRWKSGGSFIPEIRRTGSQLAALSGFAAQFGVALGNDNSPPPAFYAAVLMSHEILGAVVDHVYAWPGRNGQKSGTLVDFYEVHGTTAALRRERAIKRLSRDVTAGVSLKTGIIDFQVGARDPSIALQIAKQALAELARFNLTRRQNQAAAERAFTESRQTEARDELRDSENKLQLFLQRNRDYRNSPELVFEFERLSREASLRQQIYASVSQAYEQARIEEVRNTPVYTILDQPQLPVRPERRGIRWKVPMSMLFGIALVWLGALVSESVFPSTPVARAPTEELALLLTARRHDLRRPWRLLRAHAPGAE